MLNLKLKQPISGQLLLKKIVACMGAVALVGCGSSTVSDSSTADSKTEAVASQSDSSTESTEVTAEKLSEVIVESETESEAEAVAEVIIPEAFDESIAYSHTVTITGVNMVASNEKLDECLAKLDEIAEEFGRDIAFSYENQDTGVQVNYNSNQKFMTCSTIKAPYVKSILASGIDLDEEIVKDKSWSGDVATDSNIAGVPYGTKLTARELIEAAIQNSDNTAYYLLEQHYGWNVFNNLQYEIGANYYVGSSWIFTSATTADMLKSYRDIYEFGEENELGEWLTDLMTDTDVNMQIGKKLSEKYKVSQKYGSEFGERVYNDCAIVYADSPFVLCIYSNQYPETEESSEVFIELADIFDELNSLLISDTDV